MRLPLENASQREADMNARILALAVVVLLAPLAADAQSYRCIGADGKRYYGSVDPGAVLRPARGAARARTAWW